MGTVYPIIITFALCVFSYLTITLRSACGSMPQDVFAWKMAYLYPINFLVTFGLLMVDYFVPRAWGRNAFDGFSFVLEGLNGFFNVATYAFAARIVRESYGSESTGM